MKPTPLADSSRFQQFSTLFLNEFGRFVEPNRDLEHFTDAREVGLAELPNFLKRNVVLPQGVTDVFVWVHGWQNTPTQAFSAARHLFQGIVQASQRSGQYRHLNAFVPAFVAIYWPSTSSPGIGGYTKIRERARILTDLGEAEFFLASLLGYLEGKNSRDLSAGGVLRSRGGFFVHCVGHSFGGRFLTAAVRAAATPRSPYTLSLLRQTDRSPRIVLSVADDKRFAFTVDSMLVFQMAAPRTSFGPELNRLVSEAPLSGPLVLTHSRFDRANCLWHRMAENWESGIGCKGAREPAEKIGWITLRALNETYSEADFSTRIVNVDANWAFAADMLDIGGSHSDIWYEEAIHLLLSLVNEVRGRS